VSPSYGAAGRLLVVLCLGLPLALLAASCGEDEGDGPGSCGEPFFQEEYSGGCRPRLVTPAHCETIGTGTVEVAWTTDGTWCETPWHLIVCGNPVADDNCFSVDLSVDVESGITNKGGVYYASGAAVKNSGLRTDDGRYHLAVAGWYWSHGESHTFYVK
jgi:hypothetical protein